MAPAARPPAERQPRRRRRGLRPLWVVASISTAVTGCFVLPRSPHHADLGRRRLARAAESEASATLAGLKVAIVGAGPAGLLLAHGLLDAGAQVDLFEGGSDPRGPDGVVEGRAYALGLGIRGRTAIRSVDSALWDAVTPSGFGSERFKLHLSPSWVVDLRTEDDGKGLEPSLLVYQTDLCGALLQELESRHGSSGRLSITFKAFVQSVDVESGVLSVKHEGDVDSSSADLVAGCDGVNSIVRAAMAKACFGFEFQKQILPGNLKVVRFDSMPEALDPKAVHAIPGKGGSSAFVEPTARGVCTLINWRGGKGDDLGGISDPSQARDVLRERFPIIADKVDEEVGRQFVEQLPSEAATIRCNTYHYGKAVLLGDSAHSTGGSSGQGCNTALQDSSFLVETLQETGGDVATALRTFSERRVPEGHALLELTMGPGEAVDPIRRGLWGLKNVLDNVLARAGLGDVPLQTQYTTTLKRFADLRRERDFFFGDFPTDAKYRDRIAAVEAR